MVLDKLLHHMRLSKRSRLMESDGDDDSVYSQSAPSAASSKTKLFPTSSSQHRSVKSSFWASPLKKALSKLFECNRLAAWCKRSNTRNSPTLCSSATSDRERSAEHQCFDDWFCSGKEVMQTRCDRQEQLIHRQRAQLQQQQLLICQQRQQQQELLEIQQQQKQWFATRQRHRPQRNHHRRQEPFHKSRHLLEPRQAQTLQNAHQANNRAKRNRSPLNSATCASPRKLRERLELLQKERRRSERLERCGRTAEPHERKGSQETSFNHDDLKRGGCLADQDHIGPTQIYAKPGSKITLEMSNGRYLKVRIDVQRSHREKRCSTPTSPGQSFDRGFPHHENQKTHKLSPYHWTERRHSAESHERYPRSSIPVRQHLLHNAVSRHNKSHEHRKCGRGLGRTPRSNACEIDSQLHYRPDNPGIFLSIRKQCSSVVEGIRPNVIIDAPNHHVNCFSPDEHFICHYF